MSDYAERGCSQHEQKRDGMTLDSVPYMGLRAAEIDDPKWLVQRASLAPRPNT